MNSSSNVSPSQCPGCRKSDYETLFYWFGLVALTSWLALMVLFARGARKRGPAHQKKGRNNKNLAEKRDWNRAPRSFQKAEEITVFTVSNDYSTDYSSPEQPHCSYKWRNSNYPAVSPLDEAKYSNLNKYHFKNLNDSFSSPDDIVLDRKERIKKSPRSVRFELTEL